MPTSLVLRSVVNKKPEQTGRLILFFGADYFYPVRLTSQRGQQHLRGWIHTAKKTPVVPYEGMSIKYNNRSELHLYREGECIRPVTEEEALVFYTYLDSFNEVIFHDL